ncbi:MAG: hypothetical protein ACXABN_19285 [Candidatus Thorarchaeota archaeon]|jgi:hypothetical protein
MADLPGKRKLVVTRDDGLRKEFTYTTSRDRRYLYVGFGSLTYRSYIGQKGVTEDVIAAEAIRLILDNFGG